MDEKKLRVYTTAVSIAGLSVFLLSLWEVYPYYLPGSSRGDIWSYSLMMVLLMVVCRMLPIYFAEDKTLEISFVPVLACAITGGAALAVVLFGVSTLFTVMQNPATKHYYWPLAREPRKELFNTGNILVSISAGGLPLLLAGMPDNLASLPAFGLSLLFAALCILVNLTLFILYYQVGGMGQFGTLMRQNIGGLLPNIIATVPLGLLLGIVINMPNSYFYIVLFMAPLMLARYSFKLYLDSKSMHMRTIAALSMAVDAKDHYTQGHSRRVAYYSEAIARAMHKSPSFVADVKTAALLHDVGKIGIDDAVLNKPAALTAEEFELIQQHPVMGRKIIDSIRFSDTVNDAVLYHHHRYDAKGYPAEGPAPGELPLSAAILAVADTFDAMTSDRPYRNGMSREQALAVMQEVAGSQPRSLRYSFLWLQSWTPHTSLKKACCSPRAVHERRRTAWCCWHSFCAGWPWALSAAAACARWHSTISRCCGFRWPPICARLRGRMQRVCSPRLRLMRPWPYVCCIMACCLFLWRPICAAVFGVLCSAPGPG